MIEIQSIRTQILNLPTAIERSRMQGPRSLEALNSLGRVPKPAQGFSTSEAFSRQIRETQAKRNQMQKEITSLQSLSANAKRQVDIVEQLKEISLQIQEEPQNSIRLEDQALLAIRDLQTTERGSQRSQTAAFTTHTPKSNVLDVVRDETIRIFDTNGHDVLSSHLSEHTEGVEVELKAGEKLRMGGLASRINEAITAKRETRRPLLEAFVENDRLKIRSLERGETAEVRIEGRRAVRELFGNSRVTFKGSGGTASSLISENILADGRKVSSGGHRVALRYWSADGRFLDHTIRSESVRNKDFLSGDEILQMYNDTFQDEVNGALEATFTADGRLKIQSTQTGEDSGFRIIRLGGNFAYGLGYAEFGTGGQQALAQSNGTREQSYESSAAFSFLVRGENDSSREIRFEAESGNPQDSFSFTESELRRTLNRAGLRRAGVEFQMNETGQAEFYSRENGNRFEFVAVENASIAEATLGLKFHQSYSSAPAPESTESLLKNALDTDFLNEDSRNSFLARLETFQARLKQSFEGLAPNLDRLQKTALSQLKEKPAGQPMAVAGRDFLREVLGQGGLQGLMQAMREQAAELSGLYSKKVILESDEELI